MKALLIVLLVLAALALLPVGARVRYDEDGVSLKLAVGPMRIGILPKKKKTAKQQEKEARKKKEKAAKKQAEKAEKAKKSAEEKKPAAQTPAPEKKGGSVLDFLPLLEPVAGFLGAFRRRLLLRRLVLKVTFAGGDPCELALHYGQAWAAVGNLMPHLERWFRIRKREINVQCDFTGGSTAILADLYVTITVGWVLGLGVHYGLRALKAFLQVKKKRKQREEEKAVQKT